MGFHSDDVGFNLFLPLREQIQPWWLGGRAVV